MDWLKETVRKRKIFLAAAVVIVLFGVVVFAVMANNGKLEANADIAMAASARTKLMNCSQVADGGTIKTSGASMVNGTKKVWALDHYEVRKDHRGIYSESGTLADRDLKCTISDDTMKVYIKAPVNDCSTNSSPAMNDVLSDVQQTYSNAVSFTYNGMSIKSDQKYVIGILSFNIANLSTRILQKAQFYANFINADGSKGALTTSFFKANPTKGCAAFVSMVLRNAGFFSETEYSAQGLRNKIYQRSLPQNGGKCQAVFGLNANGSDITAGLADQGKISKVKLGDLIFYYNGDHVGHVGIISSLTGSTLSNINNSSGHPDRGIPARVVNRPITDNIPASYSRFSIYRCSY